MSTEQSSTQQKARLALEALRLGKPATARDLLLELVHDQQADASAFVCLAYAHRDLGDELLALAAADEALKLDPINLVALILKADLLFAQGNHRGASVYYRTAVDQASLLGKLPTQLAQEIARAQATCNRLQQGFQQQLQFELEQLTNSAMRQAPRFVESLDLLAGRKQIYLQKPKIYYFPGLPQVQFFENDVFPWLVDLEAAFQDIRDECLAVMQDPSALTPYVQDPNHSMVGAKKNSMLNNANWSAFHLWKDGKIVEDNARKCPKTLAALENIPFTQIAGRSPSVMYSVLQPGAKIPPHHGLVNTRLICHLPLIVPKQCGLRVGNEVREVVQGKAWVFDDTIEHEAWNLSDQVRVVLLFEVWRPELSIAERRLVRTMFTAIHQYNGNTLDWTDS